MLARAAAIALTLGAALADSSGAHQAAFYLLLGAVPAAFVAALASLGDLVEGGFPLRAADVTQTVLSLLVTVLVVLTAGARSTALLSGHVPRVAVSALAGVLVLSGVQGVVAAYSGLRHRRAEPRPLRTRADRPLRRAA
jgi:hypothetical protein